MPQFTYPATIYDRPSQLLAAMGSFWTDVYQGRDQTEAFVASKCLVEQQAQLDLLEAVASISRLTVPVFHKDNWYMLTLLQSQLNTPEIALASYDQGYIYNETLQYDVIPPQTTGFAFPIPADLADVKLAMNRLTAPSLVWYKENDFRLDTTRGAILFQTNPFNDPRVAVAPVYQDGQIVDQQAVLWLFRADFDWNYVYQQFGYVLGLRLQSSEGYKQLMNAVFDSLAQGSSRRRVEFALAAMTGIPLVVEPTEVIQTITQDQAFRLVITDQNVYRFSKAVNVTVTTGQTVHAGDSLVDALEIFELNQGITPTDLQSLALDRNFLLSCFYSDLIFTNKDVPLEVNTADPSGFTKLSWGLGGFPADVERFFDELHARGVAAALTPVDPCAGEATITELANPCAGVDASTRRKGTLAHLLDRRPNPIGEPGAASLPKTINPLQFLITNVLRNAVIIRIQAGQLGENALGLQYTRMLRRLVPPQTAVIVIVTLAPLSDSVSVDLVQETLGQYTGSEPLTETVDASLVGDTRLTIRQVAGNCQ